VRFWSGVGSLVIIGVDIGFVGQDGNVPCDVKRGMLALESHRFDKATMGPLLREKVGKSGTVLNMIV